MGASESRIRSRLQEKPLVVVCGGGFGGVAVAQALDKDFNVLMIDRKNYLFHNIGALRASTIPDDFLKNIAIPYTNVLKFGSVVHAEIERITPEGVKVLGRDDLIPFDYCIIATGSSYSFPAKVGVPVATDLPPLYAEMGGAIQESQNPVIIGGGPVGLELLGEIMTVYPEKQLTLVHGHENVLSDFYVDALRNSLRQRIEGTFPAATLKLGVRVELGDAVDDLRLRYSRGQRTLTLSNGETLETDLVMFCGGAHVNSRSYEETFAGVLNDRKQLQTNEFLQVEGFDNIFALGDCCATSANFGWVAGEHAKIVSANIGKLHAQQRDRMTAVGEYPRIALIPLGPNEGASYLPFGTVGRRVTGFLKGKDCLTGMYWKQMGFRGQPAEMMDMSASGDAESKEAEPDPVGEEKISRMSVVAHMSKEEMEELMKGYDVPQAQDGQTYS